MDKSGLLLMEKTWERIQTKTFTKWVNSHLKKGYVARSLVVGPSVVDDASGVWGASNSLIA